MTPPSPAARDNVILLGHLMVQEGLRLRKGRLFGVDPKELWPGGCPRWAWDRAEGMMLGLAIGDSLGNTTEGMTPEARRARYGEIRDYLDLGYGTLPSDDTQLAFWTLEQLLADGCLVPEHLVELFCSRQVFGIGAAVTEFVGNHRDLGLPWYRCGAHSAGDGALMRIAPVLIPHLHEPSPALWADVALAAAITHNDATSTASCLAFTAMLWELLAMERAPEPAWWPAHYVELARDLEGETRLRPWGGSAVGYEGPLWRFVEQYVQRAFDAGLSVVEAGEIWYSGAFLLETVPSVLFILMKHAHDAEEAIVRAVNDTLDNDSIAAIVGAAVGALHGREDLPQRWREGLKGRTSWDDDGRVFELLDEARTRWMRVGKARRRLSIAAEDAE